MQNWIDLISLQLYFDDQTLIIDQMRRGYQYNRSKSPEQRKCYRNRSTSRSREKESKRTSSHGSPRQSIFRFGLAKVESDIKNHFRFNLPDLSTKQEQDTIAMLKSKLNEHIGPVQHISRSRETLNLGFKYDIDAMSFLETGGLTIKISSHKIYLEPILTRAFEYILNQKREQLMGGADRQAKHHQNQRSRSRNKRNKSISFSSSSSKRSRRSSSKSVSKYVKLQVYGIPYHTSIQKVMKILSYAPGGPYKILKSSWKKLKGSVCEYLQLQIDSQNADKLLENSHKLEIDGRPVIVIEDSQNPTKQLLAYQVEIQFPKLVHPSKVVKYLQTYGKIVQIVANQQIQQDGKCNGYIITFNNPSIVHEYKKLGDLDCGIRVEIPKDGQLVYRPIQILPSKYQL